MGRTRHSRHSFERPDDCPVLDFEIFDTEGNSSDAVVYNESDGIFTYKGKHFLLDKVRDPQFPSNMNLIGDVFLMDNYRGGGETLIVQYLLDEEDDEVEDLLSAECKLTVLSKLQTEKEILSPVQAANNLAAEKPFSKKRKASD
jgi:hypothetical protein